MNRGRRRLFRLALLAVSLIVGLVAIEYAVRALLPAYDPGRQIVFRLDPDGVPLGPASRTVRQRTPKGDFDLEVAFNRLGFRDRKDLAEANDSDWFVLGDSFGLGWGVAEDARFSDVLDGLGPFRVYNIAIPTDIAGYDKLLSYVRRHGALPRNLVISVCMENDLHDYDLADSRAESPVPAGQGRVRAFLRSHSALYLLLADRLQRFHPIRRLFEMLGVARAVDSDELMNKNRYDEETLRHAVALLSRVAARAKRSIILVIPSRALWVGNNREVEARVHDFFVAEAKRQGLDVLDMCPVFEATGNPMRFYFATDPHWNEKGHRLAAERLAARIGSGPASVGR